MEINLTNLQNEFINTVAFSHSTNGEYADFETELKVSANSDFLKIDFKCNHNPFTAENTYTKHNDTLYKQEVFEVFIGGLKEYWEVEINPNAALWVGRITNPNSGETEQQLLRMIDLEESGILSSVSVERYSWSGYLHIPWKFLGKEPDGEYRINFYRIRSRVSHSNPDWECDTKTCDFVCWNSTLSGENPAFHRPKRFGYLKVDLGQLTF